MADIDFDTMTDKELEQGVFEYMNYTCKPTREKLYEQLNTMPMFGTFSVADARKLVDDIVDAILTKVVALNSYDEMRKILRFTHAVGFERLGVLAKQTNELLSTIGEAAKTAIVEKLVDALKKEHGIKPAE